MMTYLITNDDLITYDWMVLIYSKFIWNTLKTKNTW